MNQQIYIVKPRTSLSLNEVPNLINIKLFHGSHAIFTQPRFLYAVTVSRSHITSSVGASSDNELASQCALNGFPYRPSRNTVPLLMSSGTTHLFVRSCADAVPTTYLLCSLTFKNAI